ncbi:MAG: helix-turn-helix domain-containing protein [Desulfobulbaceae bacterium]|nr:helix-turn-helix domain-containing protein [Desulfobulbaceae bacterium]
MKKHHPNHRLVKIHRNYTVEDITKLFGSHKNTVRDWVKGGLAVIDDKRPMLILGRDLVEFLKARRGKNKRPCKPGQLYCLRCRAPQYPAGEMAEYKVVTEKFGNLIAICPACNTIMNQRVSLAKIGLIGGKIDISFPEALRHLIEITKPTLNSDFKEGS